MRYFPHSEIDRKEMLASLGIDSIDPLFSGIPRNCALQALLNLPPAMAERDLLEALSELSEKNGRADQMLSLLGAGAYYHWIPLLVDDLASRAEFSTCYTPYQPEVSQGTLQAIFEFQSMIATLTEMEIANASMYDGATATAEAALMSLRVLSKEKRTKILFSQGLHPEYRQVCSTYLSPLDVEMIDVECDSTGATSPVRLSALLEHFGEQVAAVIIQSPNFYGVVEDLQKIGLRTHRAKAYFIVTVAEAVSLGLLPSPGSFGADIVAGEAQSFGNPLSFGGPYVGFFAARMKDLRQLPGRLVGITKDAAGKRAFTLTLSTREQHIRRERATSNICTNQGLCALRSTIYLSLVGKAGLHEIAHQSFAKAEYARNAIGKIKGVSFPWQGKTFNEFVLRLPIPAETYCEEMSKHGILAGLPLSRFEQGDEYCLLSSFTEMIPKGEIDRWVEKTREILQ